MPFGGSNIIITFDRHEIDAPNFRTTRGGGDEIQTHRLGGLTAPKLTTP
jgi:hypothetical protein